MTVLDAVAGAVLTVIFGAGDDPGWLLASRVLAATGGEVSCPAGAPLPEGVVERCALHDGPFKRYRKTMAREVRLDPSGWRRTGELQTWDRLAPPGDEPRTVLVGFRETERGKGFVRVRYAGFTDAWCTPFNAGNPPGLREKVAGGYPARARAQAARDAERVVLSVRVTDDGAVEAPEVLRGPVLDLGYVDAAMAAVVRWRYAPPRGDGRPTSCRVVVVVEFHPPPWSRGRG